MKASERENLPRWADQPGFFETYTISLHDPRQGVALWLRYHLVSPVDGDPYLEIWGFGADARRNGEHIVVREIFAPDTWEINSKRFLIHIEGQNRPCQLTNKGAKGRIEDHEKRLGWTLSWDDGPFEPFKHYPNAAMYSSNFPSQKRVTPHPDLRVSGEILFNKRRILLEDVPAIQTHTWGTKAPVTGIWAQCNAFVEDSTVSVEGLFETYPRVALFEPNISVFHIGYDGEEYLANGLFKMFTTKSQHDLAGWYFDVTSGDRRFAGTVEIPYTHLCGVAAQDPDGEVQYWYQSAIADLSLEVFSKVKGQWKSERELTAPGGCAVSILRREPDPEVALAVEDLVIEA